jgi:tetratricopeptide (TPR) repeat protein
MRILIIAVAIVALLIVAFVLRMRAPTEYQKLTSRATKLIQEEKYAEALPISEEAVEVAEKELNEWIQTFGPQHSNLMMTAQLSNALVFQAKIQCLLENQTEAENSLLRAIDVLENAVTENRHPEGSNEPPLPHLDLPEALGELGVFYWARGRFEESASIHRRAIEVTQMLFEEDYPAIQIPLVNLSAALNELGQYPEAEEALLRAIEVSEPYSSEEEVVAHGLVLALMNLVQTYEGQGKLDESQATLQRALETSRRDLGRNHPTTQMIQDELDAEP